MEQSPGALLKSLIGAPAPELGVATIILRLLMAVTLGVMLSQLYHRGAMAGKLKPLFLHTIVLLPLIGATVSLLIGNSIARAFGLIGAVSLVRFRTVIKSTFDMAFVFMGLTLGMASGGGLLLLGFIALSAFTATVVALRLFRYGKIDERQASYRLVLETDDVESAGMRLRTALDGIVRSILLSEVVSGTPKRVTYSVSVNGGKAEDVLMKRIAELEGEAIRQVVLKKGKGSKN
jgi:hypothetical protein